MVFVIESRLFAMCIYMYGISVKGMEGRAPDRRLPFGTWKYTWNVISKGVTRLISIYIYKSFFLVLRGTWRIRKSGFNFSFREDTRGPFVIETYDNLRNKIRSDTTTALNLSFLRIQLTCGRFLRLYSSVISILRTTFIFLSRGKRSSSWNNFCSSSSIRI